MELQILDLSHKFGFLILEPSGVRFAQISFRNYLVNRGIYGWNWEWDQIYLGDIIAGVVASRAQWRFGIFAVGLQMAIKSSQMVKSLLVCFIVFHTSFLAYLVVSDPPASQV